jgi:hypothetical protein
MTTLPSPAAGLLLLAAPLLSGCFGKLDDSTDPSIPEGGPEPVVPEGLVGRPGDDTIWITDLGHVPTDDTQDSGLDACSVVPGGDIGHPVKEPVYFIKDDSFEEGGADWTITFDETLASAALGPDAAETGSVGLHVVIPGEGTVKLRQEVHFLKGFPYAFAFDVKGHAAQVVGAVVPRDNQGRLDLEELISVSSKGSFASWTEITKVQNVTDNAHNWTVELEIDGPADIFIDDITLTTDLYAVAEYPAQPAEPLYMNFVIHVENQDQFVDSESYFSARARVLEDLARIFHQHGARLVIQPELPIIEGSRLYEPGWVSRLTNEYGVTWSTHTHGPEGDDITMDDVIAYVMERVDAMETMGTGPISDHNGNFRLDDLDQLSEHGFQTLSAYKERDLQAPPAGYFISPWRPTRISPYTDETVWSTHDRGSGLVFIPGSGVSITRYKPHLVPMVQRYVTAALSKVQAGQVNAYSIVDHIDHFYSHEGTLTEKYVYSDEYAEHIQAYEDMFDQLLDPLVASGHIRWATNQEIHQDFEAWEAVYCPREQGAQD